MPHLCSSWPIVLVTTASLPPYLRKNKRNSTELRVSVAALPMRLLRIGGGSRGRCRIWRVRSGGLGSRFEREAQDCGLHRHGLRRCGTGSGGGSWPLGERQPVGRERWVREHGSVVATLPRSRDERPVGRWLLSRQSPTANHRVAVPTSRPPAETPPPPPRSSTGEPAPARTFRFPPVRRPRRCVPGHGW